MSFTFLDPGLLVDRELELRLRKTSPGNPAGPWAPAYHFDMVLSLTETKVGNIDLRIGDLPGLVLYGGHIGYTVDRGHRGHRYAARAVRLLLELARRHGMTTLWITCNPDNMASRRTCELAGGEFVEIVDLPTDNDMYLEGEKQKCRYRFRLDG
ncbi:GNAT family N-acetyltransferase [Fimbriimonas ginsengisoli]|uniref:Tagatose-bisphosphate aldolase n=1 Tax=Fimbriimonas ginsengisoli Gsoil 348 TaxID=661478 RepID=A0A068NN75_FIMGI|nr:GNAT family N-acetyltransferase [Fimbriimonas ginsengisoli]AIE84911.1 tagatose-bisphosphate aldolase [Fimbriimonas ginsengisoli Gsoil 348]